jgi:hypothetical protein
LDGLDRHLVELTHTAQAAETPCLGADIDGFVLGPGKPFGIACEQDRKPLGLRLQLLPPLLTVPLFPCEGFGQQVLSFLLACSPLCLRLGQPFGSMLAACRQEHLEESNGGIDHDPDGERGAQCPPGYAQKKLAGPGLSRHA